MDEKKEEERKEKKKLKMETTRLTHKTDSARLIA